MKNLLTVANAMGDVVMFTRLPGDLLGAYAPDLRRIFVDSRLTPAEQRVVLAHEIGHARYGHGCERGASEVNRAHERQADRYAARLLIDEETYARLEAVSTDRHFLAEELHVTVEFIDWYREHYLMKLEGVTYAAPREGLNQWAYRAVYA